MGEFPVPSSGRDWGSTSELAVFLVGVEGVDALPNRLANLVFGRYRFFGPPEYLLAHASRNTDDAVPVPEEDVPGADLYLPDPDRDAPLREAPARWGVGGGFVPAEHRKPWARSAVVESSPIWAASSSRVS